MIYALLYKIVILLNNPLFGKFAKEVFEIIIVPNKKWLSSKFHYSNYRKI